MTAPNSAERKACWDARDKLWKCLDDNNDNAASCQKFQSQFEADCPAQWVKCPNFVTLWSQLECFLKGTCVLKWWLSSKWSTPHSHKPSFCLFVCFFIFPGRSSISPRGEASWNTKRRWRQKASHLLKAPDSLPKRWTADHQNLQTDGRAGLVGEFPNFIVDRHCEHHHYCYLFVLG